MFAQYNKILYDKDRTIDQQDICYNTRNLVMTSIASDTTYQVQIFSGIMVEHAYAQTRIKLRHQ